MWFLAGALFGLLLAAGLFAFAMHAVSDLGKKILDDLNPPRREDP